MIGIRKSEDRGRTKLDWLDSRHTFSFGDYYDAKNMGFRHLRIINEDRVQPGRGFASHGHQDMEIVTYVLEGALEHKDSLGNGWMIRPGEVQRMSAGAGITHSEFNPSKTESVHFLQIWIMPDRLGITPSYEQRLIELSAARGKFHVIASGHGAPGAVTLHQDAGILVALLEPGEELLHRLDDRRYAWLHVASGVIVLNGDTLTAGDGAAISAEASLKIEADASAGILLFDLV